MKYLNEIRRELDTLASQGEKGIGYQPSSDSYADSYNGSYFDGIHVKKNSLPASYKSRSAAFPMRMRASWSPATGTIVWKSSI